MIFVVRQPDGTLAHIPTREVFGAEVPVAKARQAVSEPAEVWPVVGEGAHRGGRQGDRCSRCAVFWLGGQRYGSFALRAAGARSGALWVWNHPPLHGYPVGRPRLACARRAIARRRRVIARRRRVAIRTACRPASMLERPRSAAAASAAPTSLRPSAYAASSPRTIGSPLPPRLSWLPSKSRRPRGSVASPTQSRLCSFGGVQPSARARLSSASWMMRIGVGVPPASNVQSARKASAAASRDVRLKQIRVGKE